MAATDGVELSPKSLADLRQLGAVYKGADKKVQKGLRDGLKAAGKPLAEAVLKEGSESLPSRGGLRARIAAARPNVTASLGARTPSVTISLANRQKDSLAGLDSGVLRHPVYQTGVWVAQTVRPNGFSNAFKRNAPSVRDRVNAEVQKALDSIAREAS